ncbi:putative immunity protein [Agreia pratensis]
MRRGHGSAYRPEGSCARGKAKKYQDRSAHDREYLTRCLVVVEERAHMFDHSPHAATYAAKAVGLYSNDNDRETERAWQWENLAPELRPIGFPKGF